jgi:fused signal recognition particle receptor
MFRSLKEKLKSFRKKATDELKSLEDQGEVGSGKGGKAKEIDGQPDSNIHTQPKERAKDIAKPDLKPKQKPKTTIERKRSRKRSGSTASLKRIIEKETVDQELWVEVEQQRIPEATDSSWFSKTISESKIDNILWELEIALMESDVALPVVEEIKSSIKKELLELKVKRGSEIESVIEIALRNAVMKVMQQDIIHFDNFVNKHAKPVKLMFVGVNGTGKTSAIAKIAFRLKKQKRTCVIAAGDTFRAGAIEQLEKHSNKLGIKLIKDKVGSDPAAIAFDSIEHAKARHKDVVLIDTAGRMQTNTNLMDEMHKIKRVVEPDMIIFVGDSLAGNDVVEQAIQFDKVVGIDAAILTKLDADAKGGAALSIAHSVGKPILFISVGQRYGDLVPFNPDWMVKRLFE